MVFVGIVSLVIASFGMSLYSTIKVSTQSTSVLIPGGNQEVSSTSVTTPQTGIDAGVTDGTVTVDIELSYPLATCSFTGSGFPMTLTFNIEEWYTCGQDSFTTKCTQITGNISHIAFYPVTREGSCYINPSVEKTQIIMGPCGGGTFSYNRINTCLGLAYPPPPSPPSLQCNTTNFCGNKNIDCDFIQDSSITDLHWEFPELITPNGDDIACLITNGSFQHITAWYINSVWALQSNFLSFENYEPGDEFGDEQMVHIANAINVSGTMPKLARMEFAFNGITEVGGQALASALYNGALPSLAYLDLSANLQLQGYQPLEDVCYNRQITYIEDDR